MELLRLRCHRRFARRNFFRALPAFFTAAAIFSSLPAAEAAKAKARAATVPSTEELKKLTEKTILDIDKSLETGDFKTLHATLSPTWQKQITPEQLAETYKGFVESKQRLNSIVGLEPVFEPAPAIENRLLVTSGYYPTVPLRVRFAIKYYNDAGPWRPFSLSVNFQEVSQVTRTVALPPAKESETIAATSLLDWDAALESKDFTNFQSNLATSTQHAATPERLKKEFAKPLETGVRIEKPNADGSPQVTFTKAPELDANDELHLVGTASAKPTPVNFDFTYRLEGRKWKLLTLTFDGMGADLTKPEPKPTPTPAAKSSKAKK